MQLEIREPLPQGRPLRLGLLHAVLAEQLEDEAAIEAGLFLPQVFAIAEQGSPLTVFDDLGEDIHVGRELPRLRFVAGALVNAELDRVQVRDPDIDRKTVPAVALLGGSLLRLLRGLACRNVGQHLAAGLAGRIGAGGICLAQEFGGRAFGHHGPHRRKGRESQGASGSPG